MADQAADLGLIDLDALDDEDGGLDDGLDRTKFPQRSRHQSRAERAAGEWHAQQERAALDAFDRKGKSPATLAKYEANWQDFGGFCAARGIDPYDAEPDDIRAWILKLTEAGFKPATIDGRIAAVRWHFEQADLPSPTTTRQVADTLDAARRSLGTGQRRAKALLLGDVRKIVAGMPTVLNKPPDHLRVLRDRALITLGWAAALRVSELVALNVDDISFHGEPPIDDTSSSGGVIVHIRRSKTDQSGDGVDIAVPYSRHWNSCPVRAAMTLTRRLMDTTNRDTLTGHRLPTQTNTGPLFRSINRAGRPGGRLTRQGVDGILNYYIANALGIDPSPFSTHSLRSGFVTECDNQGVPEQIIRRTTRHTSSDGLNVYDRPRQVFADTALGGEWW